MPTRIILESLNLTGFEQILGDSIIFDILVEVENTGPKAVYVSSDDIAVVFKNKEGRLLFVMSPEQLNDTEIPDKVKFKINPGRRRTFKIHFFSKEEKIRAIEKEIAEFIFEMLNERIVIEKNTIVLPKLKPPSKRRSETS